MSKSSVVARVLSGDRLECQVVSPRGEKLKLTGNTTDPQPTVDGSTLLRSYQALLDNAWAFAKFTYLKVNLPTAKEQRSAGKRAKTHQEIAEWITDLADDPAPADGVTEEVQSNLHWRAVHARSDVQERMGDGLFIVGDLIRAQQDEAPEQANQEEHSIEHREVSKPL